ncbi:MAG TPA: hypothetical protein VFD52_04555 [Clostridia bacterium]|nr:hypothetical protein [Clostridia bacterium]
MKNKYIKPELEVQLFEVEDIITESSATNGTNLDSSASESDAEFGDET